MSDPTFAGVPKVRELDAFKFVQRLPPSGYNDSTSHLNVTSDPSVVVDLR